MTRTLIGRFAKTPEKARYREAAMREFFPHAMVENYEHLIADMKNHPKDRHVFAAAMACRADYLVTFNLKDFVPGPAVPQSTAVIGPSTFLKHLAAVDRAIVDQRLGEQAAATGIGFNELLDRLGASVPGFVRFLREP
jgi:hypothetical protein